MMLVEIQYCYGQTVYLKTDREQGQYIVGDIQITGGDHIIYLLSQGKYSGWHDECEISAELDLTKKYTMGD